MLKLALIGDIHRQWDDFDVAYFNASSCDAVLVLGDLPGRTHSHTRTMARSLARLTTPAYFIPGNHDGVGMLHFLAELKQDAGLMEEFGRKQAGECERLEEALRPVVMTGYSRHKLPARGTDMDLIAVRPHSMGGNRLSYSAYLRERFRVTTLEESAALLKGVVDESESEYLFFLGHNGPSGLGEKRNSPWGCDFRRHQGDFGDPDFREVLDYALERGKRIVGVAAGHMHHALKGKGLREWFVRDERGVPYMNCARVPRIFQKDGEVWHHHVEFRTDGETSEISQCLVSESGSEIRVPAP